ncbi:hypothetical protein [Kitasatospora sp. NPDC057223]|uniref:hypothetical protein n=1 Tax=Kitasatospora sp. NPDC057223 TaxID=3346055 RepID=UPI0036275346
MPSDRIVALGVVATLTVFGAAIATLDVSSGPGPGSQPGAVSQGTPAERPARQVLMAAAQGLDDSGSARIRTDRQGPAGQSSADGTLSWGARDIGDLRLTDRLGSGRVLVVDGLCYVAHDAPAGGLPGGRWQRSERAGAEALDPAGAGAGGYAGGWMTGLVSNPSGRLRSVALVGKLSTVGTEDVGGTPATHYRASATVEALFGADQNLTGPRLAAVLGYYRAQGTESVDYDVWITEEDRLLRMRQTVQGPAGTEVTTTAVSDPGVAFEVRAPAPAEVVGG